MAEPYIKVNAGSENIYNQKTDIDGTITYNSKTNTITLNNYVGGNIVTNVANLKIVCYSGATAQQATGANGSSTTLPSAVTIKVSSVCSTTSIIKTSTDTTTTTDTTAATTNTTTKNPETLDPIVGYVILAVFSVIALIARKLYHARH